MPATPQMIQSLAAVRPALGEALHAASQALVAGGAAAAQGSWQSAHAALQVVDHHALVKFSGELGALLSAAESDLKSDRAVAFAAGSDALIQYVEEFIGGRRDQPLRLFAAYDTVQRARGVGQPMESDLFFPKLEFDPAARADTATLSADELRNTRRVYEAGLLAWLRKSDLAGLRQIADAVDRVEAAQQGAARRVWWVARAVLDALLNDGLAVDALARRVLSQLNLHLGRLVQGPAHPPEALLKDALYLAARAKPVTPLIGEVQQTCGLHGALDTAEPAPAGFSAEALAAARAAAQGLQDIWSACAAGNAKFSDFESRARTLADVCEPLGEMTLTALVSQLADTAGHLAQSGPITAEAPVLEGACALLMIDHVLASDRAPDAGFAPRAGNMAARLKVSVQAPEALASMPRAQWLDDAAAQAQSTEQDQQVRGEIARDVHEIELALETWFGNTGNSQLIAGLDKPFRHVSGALSVLGHAEASALAGQCRAEVQRFVAGAPADAEAGQVLARRVTLLAAFVDALRFGPARIEGERVVSAAGPVATEAPVVEVSLEAKTPVVEAASAVLPEIVVPPAAPEAPAPVVESAEPVAAAPVDNGGDGDAEMLEIFIEEASEVLQTIADTVPQSRAAPQDQELLTTLRRGFHTLKGSGRMVGLKHLGEAAWEMEQVFNDMTPQQQPGSADLYRLVDRAHGDFTRWIEALRSQKRATIDAAQLIDWAKRLRAGAALPAAEGVAIAPPVSEAPAAVAPVVEAPRLIEVAVPPPEATAPPGELAPVTVPSLEPVPAASELAAAPPVASDTVMIGDISVSRSLYDIMLPEARQTLAVLAEHSARVQSGEQVSQDFVRAAHTLSGISGTAGLSTMRALGASLERVLEDAVNVQAALPVEARAITARAVSALHEQVERIANLAAPDSRADLVAALDGIVVQRAEPPVIELPVAERVPEPVAVVAAVAPVAGEAAQELPVAASNERRRYRLNDDIDAQLLPIFLEEAAELVPQVGQDLRAWRARPEDKLVAQSLKRLLHTLKGSARMAGAMALGQLTHSMESRIENAQRLQAIPEQLIDELETSFDRIGTLINQLQEGEPAPAAPAPLPQAMEQMSRTMQIATASGAMTQMIPMQYGADVDAAGAAAGIPRPMIRVRADLIDRLANQAGEVSIARARVSAELRSARTSLKELTENVSRLRAQLRELEIQAETQMQSRFATGPEQASEHFDPLEFDRFTRLQELTRLMAESVNDVATVQHSLARDLDEGEKALASQAQTTRDVQQDLMAIRMVPFASISDRLYRVTRLSAKDSEKRVGLDIVGEQVEVDRGVMDRIAAPIEHLLRNSIVHGVESPQRRLELGKPEAGALKLDVRQEGNEVVLTLSDDGDGLNIERIREKAISLGMMREDEHLTDQQIGNFIFRSGFSTASAVTAEAGRGVGMDVVMSEVTALGGRVNTEFERGKGTTFTIHLPLTLSVLQAVVMRLGGNYFAVPTMMVEQVQRLKTEILSAAHAAGEIEWQGAAYPFHHLARLLDVELGEEAPQYGSVILLRGGSNRAAIQVDDIVGGQEIVIKNIGPQIARVPGITGAAVLGSGETVLILNPVLLSARRLESMAKAGTLQPAAVEALPAAPLEPERQRSVLVVDDSLTVRKITDRLLTREGYRVLVAKDGVEALEKLRDGVPDVMITDVEMPRMDGFDLVKNVRAETGLKSLPIIMITSRTADKHRQHASEIGVDVFLGKPYEESELLGHISTLARRPVAA